MRGFAAGWDGGGTKTAVCCVNEDGQMLGRASFGSLNINGAPIEQVRKTVAQIMGWIQERQAEWGSCGAMAIGTAGATNPKTAALVTDAVRGANYGGPLLITGDQDIALRGAVGHVGAVLIAGTGTIACGRNAQGQTHRSGGFGYLIDDEGSGYAIGRDILGAVVRAYDGRIEKTVLTEAVFAMRGVSGIPELIRDVYENAALKQHVAELAPLLLEGLAVNDTASLRIAEKAARELAGMLGSVLGALQLEEGPFAFLGGVLEHYPAIAEGVLSRISAAYPRARRIAPQGDAAMGAAAIARDMLA